MSELVAHADDWIDQDRERRPRVLRGVRGQHGRREQRRAARSQMPARGETDDADAFAIDVPFARTLMHDMERLLHVLQRPQVRVRHVPRIRRAVLQHEGRHTELAERTCDVVAFLVDRHAFVAAAGTDHDGRHRTARARRQEHRQGRPRDFLSIDPLLLRIACRFLVRRLDRTGNRSWIER